ncbi:MAG: ribosome-associated translation inhibitor RaiA [bacterium]|nr:ribosome-associated translation inhibitor RaiA [bacterium]
MNYNLKGTGIDITDELRGYVEKKLELHTDKFLSNDTTAHADVELEYQELRHGEHYRAEFTLEASGILYRAESWGVTLHEAVDLALAELQKELRRNKKMKLKMFRHTAVKVKEFLRGWRNKI